MPWHMYISGVGGSMPVAAAATDHQLLLRKKYFADRSFSREQSNHEVLPASPQLPCITLHTPTSAADLYIYIYISKGGHVPPMFGHEVHAEGHVIILLDSSVFCDQGPTRGVPRVLCDGSVFGCRRFEHVPANKGVKYDT